MGSKGYSDAFKRDAVKLMTEQGWSRAQASKALGVSTATLSNWKKTVMPAEQADLAWPRRTVGCVSRSRTWSKSARF
jgi:transposase-like protein